MSAPTRPTDLPPTSPALDPRVAAALAARASPTGWQAVSADDLRRQAPLSDRERARYFDGAQPDWRHAVDPGLPRRPLVDLLADMLRASAGDVARAAVLLGPVGEGKTTALLQTAARLALVSGWNILWRPMPGAALSATAVAQLEGGPWLLVFDDAQGLLDELDAVCGLLELTGRSDVFLLGAARDTDWQRAVRARGPQRGPVGGLRIRVDEVTIGGLERAEARAIVDAWQAAGASPAGDDPAAVEGLAEALVAASAGPRSSLLGGALALRYGADGLVPRVAGLLADLGEVHRTRGGPDLERALLALAAADVGAFGGIHPAALGELVGVPPGEIWARVVMPLGDEAAVVMGDGVVHCRHAKVAEAALVAAHTQRGADLGAIYADLARAVARAGRRQRLGYSHGRTLRGPKHLPGRLPAPIAEAEQARIAVLAARAVAEAHPRVDALLDLVDTLLKVDRVAAARQVFVAHRDGVQGWDDFVGSGRGFYLQWALCQGAHGPTVAADPVGSLLLAAYAISDGLDPLAVGARDARLALARVGRAAQLADGRGLSDEARGRGLRAAAILGRLTGPDRETAGDFDSHQKDAAGLGFGEPIEPGAALADLAALYAAARALLSDPALDAFLPPTADFGSLRAHLRGEGGQRGKGSQGGQGGKGGQRRRRGRKRR